MKAYRPTLTALALVFVAGISSAQTTTGAHKTASGASRALPQALPKTKPKSNRANAAGLQPRGGGPSISLLGSVVTASPAESFALNGTLAYVCDNNEISVIDVSNPQGPQVVATAASGLFQNSAITFCGMLRGALTVFSDQANTSIGDSPGVSSFDLTNPLQPTLIAASPIDKRFFGGAVYIGNTVYVPTAANTFVVGSWDGSLGDLLAIDLTSFSSPVLLGTLEMPQIDPVYGGSTPVDGITEASSTLIYLGGATSSGGANNGVGRLQAVDVTNPAAMQVVTQLAIPGALLFYAPLIQGNVAVGIGNTGGIVGSFNANPGAQGNIVVTTFDVTDLRSPAILSINTLSNYSVGMGGGATQIGPSLFAFAGVQDSIGNPVMLIVDATNPAAPVFSSYPIPQPFSSMQAVGSTLYATLGSNGFGIYSIPGIPSSPAPVCPVSIDTVLVVDRGANITSASFQATESALDSFLTSLQFPPDQAGVVTFTTTAVLDQTLSTNQSQVTNVLNAMLPIGPPSYIGAGIEAAQRELLGPRHNPSATPVMIVISDGADLGAPSPGASLAAATAAKTAGIQIISVQYGTTASTLMQSIASSAANYYLAGP